MTPLSLALALVAADALGDGDPSSTRTPGRSYRGRAGAHPIRVRRLGAPWAWSAAGGSGTADTARDAIVAALQHVSPLGDDASIVVEALDDSGTTADVGANDLLPSSSAVSSIQIWREANGWRWGVNGREIQVARSRGAALLAALDAWAKAGVI